MRSIFRLLPAALMVSVFCGPAFSADEVQLQNDMSACVALDFGEMKTDLNIVSVSASIRLHQPIGACGCKSALATYRSIVENAGFSELLQEAVILLKQEDTKTFVVASEPALIAGRTLQIHLSCARPL